jgi:hypothetical protein
MKRTDDGSVSITFTDGLSPESGGKLLHNIILPSNIWASAVLNMTAFGELPNQWSEFMAQHNGLIDHLTPEAHRYATFKGGINAGYMFGYRGETAISEERLRAKYEQWLRSSRNTS